MFYPDVPALEPEEIELLCSEYVAHNAHLDPREADRLGVKRGLRNADGTGVLAGITNVSNVIGYEKRAKARATTLHTLQTHRRRRREFVDQIQGDTTRRVYAQHASVNKSYDYRRRARYGIWQ